MASRESQNPDEAMRALYLDADAFYEQAVGNGDLLGRDRQIPYAETEQGMRIMRLGDGILRVSTDMERHTDGAEVTIAVQFGPDYRDLPQVTEEVHAEGQESAVKTLPKNRFPVVAAELRQQLEPISV